MNILCQDPLSIVVQDEDSLDCVQGWFQQHIFKGHGGLCKIPVSGFRGSYFKETTKESQNMMSFCIQQHWPATHKVCITNHVETRACTRQSIGRQPEAQKGCFCFLMKSFLELAAPPAGREVAANASALCGTSALAADDSTL